MFTSSNKYQALLSFGKKGPVERHLSYMAAGWLLLFRIRPNITMPTKASSISDVALAAAFLLGFLYLCGPIVNVLVTGLSGANFGVNLTKGLMLFALAIHFIQYAKGYRVMSLLSAQSAHA